MKEKKSILRGCPTWAFLMAVGLVAFLCFGCDAVDTPIPPSDETTQGDQITEEASVEEDTLRSTDDVYDVEDETNAEVSGDTDAPDAPDDQEPASSESASTDEDRESTAEPPTAAPEEPTESVTEATTQEPEFLAYDAYHAMSAAEQEAHFNSFESPAAFFEWYNAAKAKYLEEHPNAEIGPDGSIILP